MKKIITSFLLFLLSINTLFTSTNIDSLLNILSKQADDTNKVRILSDITYFYLYSNQQKAFEYLDSLFALSNKINSYKGKILYYVHTGILQTMKGNFDSSNIFFNNAHQIALDEKDDYFQAMIKLNIGCNYDQLGNYEKALESFNQSIEICKKHNLKSLLGNNYIALGILNVNFKNYEEAEKNYFEAIKIFENFDDTRQIAKCYNNLANVYIAKGENEKALFYAEKASKIYKELKENHNLALTYHTLGVINYNLKNYKESENYLLKSIEIKEKLNNQIGKTTSLLALAEIYTNLKEYSKAITCLDQAKEIFQASNLIPKLMAVYGTYHEIYYKLGNYQKAYDYLNQYYQIKDSLFNLEKDRALAEYNAKYNLEKKEKDNILLQNEKQRLSLYIIIFILALIILVGLAIALFINNRYIKKLNRQLKELNATKDKFFSIISHDLKNPISALYKLLDILVADYEDLSEEERIEILKQLNISSKNTYSLLENLLTWARTQQNKVNFKPETINLYDLTNLIIKQLHSNWTEKQISVTNNIPQDAIIKADPNLLSAIIRNIISNSIKYTNNGGEITLNLTNENKNGVIITISDNGIGMNEETANSLFAIDKTKSLPGTNNEKGTGLGLILSKEFVEMHKGRIWVESELEKGTKVFIALPQIQT